MNIKNRKLYFEDTMRFYDIDGLKMPSVTTVLDVLPKPLALKYFINNNPNAEFIAAERAFIGTMSHFHFETENCIKLNKTPILEEVDKQFDTEYNRGVIEDIKMKINFFILDNKLIPLHIEEKLWSYELQTAGRCDYIGYLNGVLSIIDLKTSKAFYESDTGFDSHSLQLSAYKQCAKETLGLDIQKLFILRVHEDSWWELKEKEFDIGGFKYARELFREKYGC